MSSLSRTRRCVPGRPCACVPHQCTLGIFHVRSAPASTKCRAQVQPAESLHAVHATHFAPNSKPESSLLRPRRRLPPQKVGCKLLRSSRHRPQSIPSPSLHAHSAPDPRSATHNIPIFARSRASVSVYPGHPTLQRVSRAHTQAVAWCVAA